MKIKSYFANSVEGAISLARNEFGPEAMLMNSRKSLPDSRHLGEYEVVFACPAATDAAAVPSETHDTASTASPADLLQKEIADLRRQLERMAAGVTRAKSFNATNVLTDPLFANLFSGLLAAEVDAGVANTVLTGLRSRGTFRSEDEIVKKLRQEVENLCGVDSTLGRGESNRVVALVGPPGSGKTTALVKLAMRSGLPARKPTQFLTIDTERIAAADQLHTFAEILGAGFRAVESTHALSQAIEEHRNKHLTLIDTPGLGTRDVELAEQLAAFFSRREDIDVHLVLPCNLKSADLSATVDRFSDFYPHKLLFTKLDETRTFGTMLNESVRTGKPVSFLSTGQRIPEDFESGTKERIAGLVLGDISSKAAVAAA
jgi:flagellar biosynthesis protein FlhF